MAKHVKSIRLISTICLLTCFNTGMMLDAQNQEVSSKFQESRFQKIIQNPKQITIVVLTPRVDFRRVHSEWSKTVRDNLLINYSPSLYVIEEDQSIGQIDATWFRNQYGLKHDSWALISPQGKLLSSGAILPSPGVIRDLIAQTGESSPVSILENFLLLHPSHEPARYNLIRVLSQRIPQQLKTPPSNEPHELSSSEDKIFWEELAEHLERFFRTTAWLSPQMDLSYALPAGDPERYSPCMRALYHRLRPKICEILRSIPDHLGAARLLLRVDRVLDETRTLDTFSELNYFHTPFHAVQLPRELPGHLLQVANRTGAWNKTIPLLRFFWDSIQASDLRNRPQLLGVHASDPKRLAREKQLLLDTWSRILAPLLEALVQGGSEVEAKKILSNLDERWSVLDLPKLASDLARRIKRSDLITEWTWTFSKGFVPPPLSLYGTEPGYQMLSQFQPNSFLEAEFGQLETSGLRIYWVEDINPGKRSALGWISDTPKWALINPEGKVVLEGNIIPAPATFFVQFKDSGLMLPVDLVRFFLRDNPGHLGATRALALELRRIIDAQKITFNESNSPNGNTSRLGVDLPALWRNYQVCLDTILEHPLGSTPSETGLSIEFLPFFPVLPDAPSNEAGILRQVAKRHLPAIEALIENRPTDPYLWAIWQGLGHLVGQPLRPFLAQLEFGPKNVEVTWDPKRIVETYASLLLADARWEQVITELEPEWLKFKERVETLAPKSLPPGEAEQCYQGVVIPLVLSSLRTGHNSQADDIIRQWVALGRPIEPPNALLELTEKLGYHKQADSWKAMFLNSRKP